jgi:hypothetical protein
MSLATQFDQTREAITERYRRRLEQGDRTKLTRDERETLTVLLLDQLIALNQLSITQKSAEWLQGLGFSSELRAFE